MVRLVPMTETDYRRFLRWSIEDYAQQQVRAGAWKPETAVSLAEQMVHGLLPEGLDSPDQTLCSILDAASGEPVGYLWYGLRSGAGEQFVALYEFLIFEAHRRRGYGTAALKVLEDRARELGVDRILLHVFGHNEAARALYQKLGYVERNVTMVRRIG
jgi:RimJ/RimL family protein N-acetyltransferase